MRRAAAQAALVLLLAACGMAGSWEKPGADRDMVARDRQECRAQSEQALARDHAIDADILATRGADWQRAGSIEPQREQMHEHAAAAAAAIFDACMRAKGYARRG